LSGKSDEYTWFLVHATRFLKSGGRLGFVVSSAILFSDYGVPLIRFLSKHYRIVGVIDSMVERWFIDADTNTVLLLLERESDADLRHTNKIRFVRLRRPLAQLLPEPLTSGRRQGLEDLVELVVTGPAGDDDPRYTCVITPQGDDGGLSYPEEEEGDSQLTAEDEDEDDT
jgi:hypothetical protein